LHLVFEFERMVTSVILDMSEKRETTGKGKKMGRSKEKKKNDA